MMNRGDITEVQFKAIKSRLIQERDEAGRVSDVPLSQMIESLEPEVVIGEEKSETNPFEANDKKRITIPSSVNNINKPKHEIDMDAVDEAFSESSGLVGTDVKNLKIKPLSDKTIIEDAGLPSSKPVDNDKPLVWKSRTRAVNVEADNDTPETNSAEVSSSESSVISKTEELRRLVDDGVLTESEYHEIYNSDKVNGINGSSESQGGGLSASVNSQPIKGVARKAKTSKTRIPSKINGALDISSSAIKTLVAVFAVIALLITGGWLTLLYGFPASTISNEASRSTKIDFVNGLILNSAGKMRTLGVNGTESVGNLGGSVVRSFEYMPASAYIVFTDAEDKSTLENLNKYMLLKEANNKMNASYIELVTLEVVEGLVNDEITISLEVEGDTGVYKESLIITYRDRLIREYVIASPVANIKYVFEYAPNKENKGSEK
jgi:hypothetical protein